MATDLKRHFDKAQATRGHSRPFAAWFKDGDYKLTVLRVEVRRNDRGVFFIAEFLIDDARPISQFQPNAIGERVSICHNVATNDNALPNVVEFVGAVLGAQHAADDKIQASIDKMIADDQPARGMTLGARTFRKRRFNGEDFIGVNFFRIVEHDPAQVFVVRSTLDAKGL